MEFLDSRIASANEAQLVALMYEGLIEKLKESISHIESGDALKLNKSIDKSRAIIAELLATLRGDYEITSNYKSLYLYLNELITKAHISRDVVKLEESISVVTPLYEGWRELGEKMFKEDIERGNSSPVMSGMTYGKGYLHDDISTGGRNFEA